MSARTRWRAVALLVTMLCVGVMTGTSPGPALADTGIGRRQPTPVYGPEAADPGLVRDGSDYYAFMTGGPLARVAKSDNPSGPWTAQTDALSRWGDWASGQGAVWAPDVWHTSAGWVLYYAAQAKGFAGQRCIGTATADHPGGPYTPADTPLICPLLNGEDPVGDRPDPTAGVIDPNPFQDNDGQRYLLYKTQKTPGTIRMFPLSADGLHGRDEASHELVRHGDSIENPVMVKRADQYVLFASANWFDQCRYSTVWRRTTDLWSFADKEEHVLLDQANTGLCGPGGADVVADDRGPDLIFLHGWVCSADDQPCGYDGVVSDPAKRRVMYAARLIWGRDGASPRVTTFLPNSEEIGPGSATLS